MNGQDIFKFMTDTKAQIQETPHTKYKQNKTKEKPKQTNKINMKAFYIPFAELLE